MKTGFSILTVFILIMLIVPVGHSAEFPADRESAVISIGGFYGSATDLFTCSERDKNVSMELSCGWFFGTDVAFGFRGHVRRPFTTFDEYTDWGFGPQFMWFIGGHMHRQVNPGAMFHYLGLAFMMHWRFYDKEQILVEPAMHLKSSADMPGGNAYHGLGIRLGFGLGTALSRNIVLSGEASFTAGGVDNNNYSSIVVCAYAPNSAEIGVVLSYFVY